ncbi:MAG: hypothetical protein ACRECV_17885 [Xanthobacteraceae bacterium]
MTDWTPLFLMPNLRVIDPVGVDEAAIVNADDERVRDYCRQFPQFRNFISKFTDPFGHKKTPGIFLFQTESPKNFHTMEAVSSFRDLVALSVIPLQRARSLLHGHSFYTQYADYFDFYPWSFNDKNGHLVCSSPALSGLDEIESFRGQSSPVLSPQDFNSTDVDNPLLQVLLKRWRQRYGANKALWPDIALFRSLNTAFAASKIPAGSDITQFHVGRSIALWVSAFEILIHTGTQNVKLSQVYNQIVTAPWKEKSLLRKGYKPYAMKTKEPLPCWIYGELHRARNDYLHGNPIGPRRLIVKKSKRHLFNYAALLYRMALSGFLPIPKPDGDPQTFSRARYDFLVNQNDIERALSTIRLSEKAYRAKREAELKKVKIVWRAGSGA